MTSAVRRTVIVGASVAGLGVAESLRAVGYEDEIVVLDKDAEQPCDRPPLTKAFLLGREEGLTLPFAAVAKEASVEILLGQDVISVDVERQRVTSASGHWWDYSTLVLATGSTARRLGVPGSDSVDVHVIRDRRDAAKLRRAATDARVALVVGAGVLGLEVASSLRRLGLQVHVITNVGVPLVPDLGPEVAAFEEALMRAAGVSFVPCTSVSEYAYVNGHIRAVLDDGRVLHPDLVVEAVGALPATGWLAGSGLRLDNGVECDATLSAAPNVFAVGDVCRWHNPRYGRRMRIEHWTNALDQAAVVAANIVSDSPEEYRGIPYFWSDHFEAHLQFAGSTVDTVERVCEASSSTNLVVRYLDADGTQLGVLTVNEPRPIVEHRQRA